MLTIYGSKFCPDCVCCLEDLDRAQVSYRYLDFADSLRNLKVFLDIREKDEQFLPIRTAGKIGIPCIVRPDGTVTLSWEEFL